MSGDKTKTPPKPSRNTFLVFMAAWDQFQEFRKQCDEYNANRKSGDPKRDPVRDFKRDGIDAERIREDTNEKRGRSRPLHKAEVLAEMENLAFRGLLNRHHTPPSFTFGGQHDEPEKFGARLAQYRTVWEDPKYRSCWSVFVLLAALGDGVPRLKRDIALRSGLIESQVETAVNRLRRGIKVKFEGEEKLFKGKLVERNDMFRLPDELLWDDDEEEEEVPALVIKVDMTDAEFEAKADEIRKELAKVGGEPIQVLSVDPPTSVVNTPSADVSSSQALNGKCYTFEVEILRDEFDEILAPYLQKERRQHLNTLLEGFVEELMGQAKKFAETQEIKTKIEEAEARKREAASKYEAAKKEAEALRKLLPSP